MGFNWIQYPKSIFVMPGLLNLQLTFGRVFKYYPLYLKLTAAVASGFSSEALAYGGTENFQKLRTVQFLIYTKNCFRIAQDLYLLNENLFTKYKHVPIYYEKHFNFPVKFGFCWRSNGC